LHEINYGPRTFLDSQRRIGLDNAFLISYKGFTTQPDRESRMTLAQLQRIKHWQVAHRAEHPLELHLFDAVLTVWVMGWVGLLPTVALQNLYLLPVCFLATQTPELYRRWRAHLHRQERLRCDWLGV
jgi:hypothetical protein